MSGARVARGRAPARWVAHGARLAARSVASALVALLAVELVLRLAGVQPKEKPLVNQNEPIMHAPDPVLGWKPVPGSYTIPPYAPGAAAIDVRIERDGARATALSPPASGPEVVLLGCSFAFGWGISDDETLAWRLQEQHPELRFVNRAVKAYGTYQALLVLEQMLAAGERPARVIYAFHASHEERNVASPRWLGMLERFSRRGGVALPYATLGADGTLERHPPERERAWPLRETLATVSYLEDLASRSAADRRAHGRRVTGALIVAMRELCARHGVRFDVLLLQASPRVRRHYARFLTRSGIPFADCVVPIPPHLRVPGEGHPGPVINEQWAACAERTLFAAAS